MSGRGKRSSTETWLFIDLMVRTTFFFTEAFNPPKTNSKLCYERTQSINAAATWENFGDFKTLLHFFFEWQSKFIE